MPIKANQKLSLQEIEKHFKKNSIKIKRVTTREKAHGRQEQRSCELLSNLQLSERFEEAWLDAKSIFSIRRSRIEPDKRSVIQTIDENGIRHFGKNENELREKEQTTFFVSSLKLTPKEALEEARKHWGIENNLHWVLDAAFAEDSWTVRAKGLARSLSLLRKVAFNLIQKSKTTGSVRARMKRAGWNNQFLDKSSSISHF
jgi:predicted transposase YbfD/YdcC